MTATGREGYFEVAGDILATMGCDGLTIARMCRRMGLTTGSFYHHFGSWQGFVEQFLKHWEATQTNRIIELVLTVEEPEERLALLFRLAAEIPHEAEAAIRAWAKSDTTVGAAQRRVDVDRLAFTEELVDIIIDDRARAETLAALVVSAFVGLELLGPIVEDRFRAVLDEVYATICPPEPPRSARPAPPAGSGARRRSTRRSGPR
jgi:AcrR family transcriptional regulator